MIPPSPPSISTQQTPAVDPLLTPVSPPNSSPCLSFDNLSHIPDNRHRFASGERRIARLYCSPWPQAHMAQQLADFKQWWLQPPPTGQSSESRPLLLGSSSHSDQPAAPTSIPPTATQLNHSSSTHAIPFGSIAPIQPPPIDTPPLPPLGPPQNLPPPPNRLPYTPQYPPPYEMAQTPPYRPPKIDLPHFTNEDVLGWLAIAECYHRLHNVPHQEHVQTVASLFDPDPSV